MLWLMRGGAFFIGQVNFTIFPRLRPLPLSHLWPDIKRMMGHRKVDM
jgi:hypothetical protein